MWIVKTHIQTWTISETLPDDKGSNDVFSFEFNILELKHAKIYANYTADTVFSMIGITKFSIFQKWRLSYHSGKTSVEDKRVLNVSVVCFIAFHWWTKNITLLIYIFANHNQAPNFLNSTTVKKPMSDIFHLQPCKSSN